MRLNDHCERRIVLGKAYKQATELARDYGDYIVSAYRSGSSQLDIAQEVIPEVVRRSRDAARVTIGKCLELILTPAERANIERELQERAGIQAKVKKLGRHSPKGQAAAARARGAEPYHDKKRTTPFGFLTEGEYAFERYRSATQNGGIYYGFWVDLSQEVKNLFGNDRTRRNLYQYCRKQELLQKQQGSHQANTH